MGYQLKKAGIDILHIDNGLLHEGLETNKEFLNKTKLGIENLSKLYDNVTDKKTFSRTVNVLRTYNYLRFFRLTTILAKVYIRYRDRMEIRLEFATEGHRFFDLRRWDIDDEVLNDFIARDQKFRTYMRGSVYNPVEDDYLPLPASQVQFQKGVLQQDPSYQ